MSKIYQALQRLEAERDVQARGIERPTSRPSSPGRWWKGVSLGFAVGLGAAVVVVSLVPGPQPGSAPPEEGIAEPPAVSDPPLVALSAATNDTPPPPVVAMQPATDAVATEGAPKVGTTPLVALSAATNDTPPPPVVAVQPATDAVATEGAPKAGTIWVQVGTFRDRDNATRLHAKLMSERYPAIISPGRSAQPSWAVRVGAYPDHETAERTRTALQREGLPGLIITDANY